MGISKKVLKVLKEIYLCCNYCEDCSKCPYSFKLDDEPSCVLDNIPLTWDLDRLEEK